MTTGGGALIISPMTEESPRRSRRLPASLLAWGLAAVSAALVGTAVIAAAWGGLSLADAVNSFKGAVGWGNDWLANR
jgi:hypothetical protein